MSSVDDLFTTVDVDTGRAAIYERMDSDKAVLVKEFPSREEADAYIQLQLDLDAACARIHEDFRAMAAKWITHKAEETGLEQRLVSEWLEGIDLYWNTKVSPADSANDQRGEKEDPMEKPSVVRIPDYNTPVEPPAPKAVFPLPADHECDREGVGTNYTGEWDNVEDQDLPQRIIQNAMERVAHPLMMTKMYLSGKVIRIAEAHLPPDVSKTLYWHWRIDDDLETVLSQVNAHVAGAVSANLPARFTSLDGTLRTAMVNGGLCCEEAANQLIANCLSRHEMALMEEHIPGFNREWLTIQGAEIHKETLLNPAGPRQEVWPQKPLPHPVKVLPPDSAQATLRGVPATNHTITQVDGSGSGETRPFYEASFMMEVTGIRVEVVKCSHQREELEQDCQAFQEAGEVQVSGTMTNSGSREDCDLLVLVDKWLPITEEADAAAP